MIPKRHLLVLAATLLALVGPARAVTATNTFSVSITLNSACQVISAPSVSFSYTSFQTSAATSPASNFNIQCTNTKSITSVLLDNGSGGLATGLSQSYTDATTGLNYTLTLSAPPAAGNGATQTMSVTGTMPANQSGQCNAASCTSTSTRTITITY